MEKTKIIHIAQSAGGVAEYLYMFLSNENNNKYEHILILSKDYEQQKERFEKYSSHIEIVDIKRDIKLKDDIKSVFNIRKCIRKITPDIVYMHSSKAGALGRIAMTFNFKIKKIYNSHGWYFNAEISDKKKKLYTIIEKILAYKTDVIVNISKSEYESALEKKIAKKEKLVLIDNGIDFKKFENVDLYREHIRNNYNISNDCVVIGVVGRLTDQKDPMASISAFKIVKEKYENCKLMFVGSGELEKHVIDYAKEHNLEKDIIITGWVSNVEKYISAFDIAILPSKWEGFGLVIVEYMACKKPIVATKVGGIENIICDKEKGILIEKENYIQLKDSLIEIMETNIEDIRTRVEKNYNYARENYDISRVAKEHEYIFKIN